MNTFNKYLVAIGSLFFVIGSGFSPYIRILAFFILIISFFINIFQNKFIIKPFNFLIIFFFTFCYLIGVINNLLNSTTITDIFSLTIYLIILFPIFLIIFNSFNGHVIDFAIQFISISIPILFFSFFIFLISVHNSFGLLLVQASKNYFGQAYFYYRPFFIFENYPLIWVQASIFVMPLAIWNLFKSNFKTFVFLGLVVFLSLNRTGSFLILFFYFLSCYRINFYFISNLVFKLYFLLPLTFLLTIFFITYLYGNNFQSTFTGFDIRLGHLFSVVNYLLKDLSLFFGMGADSEFISLGWQGDGITRDQEISYLEILRRFGLIGFFFFNLGIFFLLYKLSMDRNLASFFSFLCYLIYSFTNPSLISFIFILFVSLHLSTFNSNTKHLSKHSNHNYE